MAIILQRTLGKSSGLRKKQVIFLQELAKARGPLTRDTLCRRTSSHPTNVTLNALGSNDPETRERREKNRYPSLLTLGLVLHRKMTIEGEMTTVYEITAKGRETLKIIEDSNSTF